jgi:hypothetical protein
MTRFNASPDQDQSALYFTTTRPFRSPEPALIKKFDSVQRIDSFPILRDNGLIAGYGFIYLLNGYNQIEADRP